MDNRNLLAFVHIEKTAGTTFNHILRTNFLLKHYDVRPFSIKSNKIFQVSDLKTALKINPFVQSISGHSVQPWNGLEVNYPNIKYITLLRDPVNRYVSQFQYWREGLKKDLDFDDFLAKEHSYNLQIQKIAGEENIEKAKDILTKAFFLVGIVEEFDEFLILLKKKLEPFKFIPGYTRQNLGSSQTLVKKERLDLILKYKEEIIERNKLDIELYNFVFQEILPKERSEYGLNLSEHVASFKESISNFHWGIARYIDYLYRKLYLDPITGLIRRSNGLPAKGSY